MRPAEGVYSPVLDHLLVIWELRLSSALLKPAPGVMQVTLRLASGLFVCAPERAGAEETGAPNLRALIGKPEQMNE